MIFEKIKKIIAEQLDIDADEITLDEFGIEIPDDAVEKIKTVGDIVKFVEENN